VLAVVSSEKNSDGTANVVSASDYYPFGMGMPNRSYKTNDYRYGFGGHEKEDEVSGENNYLSFGDFGYDPRIIRRWRPDPVDQIGISNYAAFGNNPIFFIDIDGRKFKAHTEQDRSKVLGYITDQLGDNHGFSFKKNGELTYSKSALNKASKNFNLEQSDMAYKLTIIIQNKDKVIEFVSTENNHTIVVPAMIPGYVRNSDGSLAKNNNGIPIRKGWTESLYEMELNTTNTGGALFWAVGKTDDDYTNQGYSYIFINSEAASNFTTGNSMGVTIPSESSAFMHETLDHGLDFIENGNIDRSEGADVENVRYHNDALKNKGSETLRTKHHD
jgi:RHS repeat-associated protein